KVSRTARSLDPQTRTLRTEIDLPNDDARLVPGMFVNVTIVAERKNVWALPVAAVVTQGEQSYCYRIAEGKAVRTPLQLGIRGDELVEVVKNMSAPVKSADSPAWTDLTGEEIIVENAAAVAKDNQAVKVANR